MGYSVGVYRIFSSLFKPRTEVSRSTVFIPLMWRSRCLHTTPLVTAGQKWRLSHGMPRSGTEYGALTDLPDWSYIDGRPIPTSKRRRIRERKQKAIRVRIKKLINEVDEAKLTSAEQLQLKTDE